jgi:hypothetical protein
MFKKLISLAAVFVILTNAFAQTTIPLNDLSAFKKSADNWRIVSDVNVDLSKENVMITSPGTGVLACIHERGKYGAEYELYSKFEHGDLDIEMDFLLAKGANSGIYLQGQYELQLYDSWGKPTAKYNDVGGIYERWNDDMPEGQKGYEGIAPRTNAAKAPGLWQHIKISFQAPRFDASGKKTQNAKFVKVELNGTTLHENVEVTGPTRGPMKANEVATGPLRIQGDHGSVAFRNIKYSNYNQPSATMSDIRYNVYYGSWMENVDLSTLEAKDRGKVEQLTWEVSKESNNYIIDYKAKMDALVDGKYTFHYQISGNTLLKVDGKAVTKNDWSTATEPAEVTVDLEKGMHSIEIINNKRDGWLKPAIGFWISGPGFRATPFHSISSMLAGKPADPILVHADKPIALRSFMDFKKSPEDKNHRVVHAISVGHPSGLHYTYDMDNASLVQAWRGDFLDATPMWENRGDGSSRPMGKALPLSVDFLVNKSSADGAWKADTTGSDYKPLGYKMMESGIPTFMFNAYGASATDAIRVKDGKILERTLIFEKAPNGLMAKIADGMKIEKVSDDLYAIDDKSYFVKAANAKIRNVNGKQQLVLPISNGAITYELMF